MMEIIQPDQYNSKNSKLPLQDKMKYLNEQEFKQEKDQLNYFKRLSAVRKNLYKNSIQAFLKYINDSKADVKLYLDMYFNSNSQYELPQNFKFSAFIASIVKQNRRVNSLSKFKVFFETGMAPNYEWNKQVKQIQGKMNQERIFLIKQSKIKHLESVQPPVQDSKDYYKKLQFFEPKTTTFKKKLGAFSVCTKKIQNLNINNTLNDPQAIQLSKKNKKQQEEILSSQILLQGQQPIKQQYKIQIQQIIKDSKQISNITPLKLKKLRSTSISFNSQEEMEDSNASTNDSNNNTSLSTPLRQQQQQKLSQITQKKKEISLEDLQKKVMRVFAYRFLRKENYSYCINKSRMKDSDLYMRFKHYLLHIVSLKYE